MTKRSFDIKRLKFYGKMAVAYFLIVTWSAVSNFDGTLLQIVLNNLWATVYIVVVNFIFFEYTIAFILRKRSSILLNILLGIFFFFFYLILWSFGLYVWRFFGIGLHIFTPFLPDQKVENIVGNLMGFSMGSVFFFGIIRHTYNYIKLKQAAQQLRIEKQEAELSYLKSQTNPHFLFNTLNNIYSLARDKNDLAPESILRLSKILRYMLYETSGQFVAVEQELKIINDYIELEKLRYDESLRVTFNYNIEDMKQALPPLLLIPLVENAFKHGVSEARENPFLDIHLSVNNQQLTFIVKNSAEKPSGSVTENIGLSNLRRQLELLYKDANLTVQQDPSVFTATLKINLSSHV